MVEKHTAWMVDLPNLPDWEAVFTVTTEGVNDWSGMLKPYGVVYYMDNSDDRYDLAYAGMINTYDKLRAATPP